MNYKNLGRAILKGSWQFFLVVFLTYFALTLVTLFSHNQEFITYFTSVIEGISNSSATVSIATIGYLVYPFMIFILLFTWAVLIYVEYSSEGGRYT